MVAIISALAYFDIRISSAVLAAGLVSEVVILLIFDGFLFARGNVNAGPLNPVNAFKTFPASGTLAVGAVGIGLFFAFWSWVGFEMAPNYGEESRDPKRIVPPHPSQMAEPAHRVAHPDRRRRHHHRPVRRLHRHR
jgi:amino acid transporter